MPLYGQDSCNKDEQVAKAGSGVGRSSKPHVNHILPDSEEVPCSREGEGRGQA